jgi:hypothetical protein
MRTNLLASLTSKIVVGVAATTLAAGSAGAAVLTQTISDESAPVETVETIEETVEETIEETPLEDVLDEGAGDETAETDETEETEDGDDLGSFDESVDTSTAHPDNFGKIVSERAHSEGGNKGGVAHLAHEKNAERKAGGAADDDADDESDDDESDDDADDESEDEADEVVETESTTSGGRGKGHGKK